jgi:antitoxin (DNA-binding transcriptional repressor) of toxin-antitoxin stability system
LAVTKRRCTHKQEEGGKNFQAGGSRCPYRDVGGGVSRRDGAIHLCEASQQCSRSKKALNPPLDDQPTIWLVEGMKTIGIFEAKTHFPALCESVASTRTPVMVSKRGRPLVMIEPLTEEMVTGRADIHTAWRSWRAKHSEIPGDFPEVWRQRRRAKDSPLRD